MKDYFVLSSAPKKYDIALDKCDYPQNTYNKALKNLKQCFTDHEFVITNTSKYKTINVFSFDDGRLITEGKGASSAQSKASAIMEYIERKSWIEYDYKNADGYLLASYSDLAKDNDMGSLSRIFDLYYSDNRANTISVLKDIPLHWVGAYSLTRKVDTLYPVNYNNYYQGTNGLASGNNKEEAIIQGLCEVIERHNIGLVVKKATDYVPQIIDVDSIGDDYTREIIDFIKDSGIKLELLNMTSDINVATICAVISINDTVVGFGFGTHTSPKKAIIRAVTESVQFKENINKKNSLTTNPEIKKFVARLSTISEDGPVVEYDKLPSLYSDDCCIEINSIIDIMKQKDLEVIVVNKNYPGMDFPVVRIFVPGLFPGSPITNVTEEEEYLITSMYYQGEQKDKAQKYYIENFDKISQKIIQEMEQSYHPHILEQMKARISPQTLPLQMQVNEHYIDNFIN